jgi:dipeptidase
MCDTIVALGNSTADGSVIFAKNSDRDPNEAQEVVLIPRQKHTAGSTVKCTYIEIPQVEETWQILLSKPFWIWGAEMGANEFGVNIGNEAVFTRIPYGKEPGLIGMDFLRLALERSKTAEEALDVITTLLEQYGQSGNCGFDHEMYYHNSFLICDQTEAWVLETAGREWAAEKVSSIRSISNAITIQDKWDRASKNLVTYAIENGWCKNREDFNFARCYSEPIYTRFSDAKSRQVCSTNLLTTNKGRISPEIMMQILRSHTADRSTSWSPDRGITGADVCMHSGWGPIRHSQTAGSMVTRNKKEISTHWVTGTAAPCTSIFKPVWMDCDLPDMGQSPTGVSDNSSLFWRHEQVHRRILEDYPTRINIIKEDQQALEDSFFKAFPQIEQKGKREREDFSRECFRKSNELEMRWTQSVRQEKQINRNNWLYSAFWKKMNKFAKLE